MAIAVVLRRKPAYTKPLHHIKNIVGCRRFSFVAKKLYFTCTINITCNRLLSNCLYYK